MELRIVMRNRIEIMREKIHGIEQGMRQSVNRDCQKNVERLRILLGREFGQD